MKKGKKRLLLGWICLLLSLCMVTVASAETDGTPIQPCHQVTMTEQKSTAQNGASISVWHITTVLGTVDAELNALADDYAAELSPLLQKPGRERTLNSSLTVRTFGELLEHIQLARPCTVNAEGDKVLTVVQGGRTRYIMLRVTTEDRVQVGLAEDVTLSCDDECLQPMLLLQVQKEEHAPHYEKSEPKEN